MQPRRRHVYRRPLAPRTVLTYLNASNNIARLIRYRGLAGTILAPATNLDQWSTMNKEFPDREFVDFHLPTPTHTFSSGHPPPSEHR